MPRAKVLQPTDTTESPSPAAASGAQTVVRLFRANARRVSSFLGYRLRSREDGQDAAQELFLKLWKRETEGQLREQATAYLNSAMRTVAIDMDRFRGSRGAKEHVDIDALDLATTQPAVDEAQFWREGVLRLVSALQEMPELTQTVFALYHFEGLSHKEIARDLALSERTVERHMARALEFCEPRMKDFIG